MAVVGRTFFPLFRPADV